MAAGPLAAAGCGSAASPAANGGAATRAPVASPAAGGGGSGGKAAACTGGLTGSEPGVVQVVCDGTATVHVHAGSVTKSFAGGQCRSAPGGYWSVTDGVITQTGTYKGPPVDVVSINEDSSRGGTIQLLLAGKVYFVTGASLQFSNGTKAAHLQGTTTADSDVPGAPVTADVAC
jgi:hypothetical protein